MVSSQDRDRYSSQALRARNSELQPWADFGAGIQEPGTRDPSLFWGRRLPLLQQCFPDPKVMDLIEGNKIAEEAIKHKYLGMRVTPIP